MRVLFLDGYNLMHRARYGFITGEFNVVYNFFRGLRPLIDKFKPQKVYFVLEGYPKERIKIYPDYKAHRKEGMTPKKKKQEEDFRRQRDIIYEIIKKFPFDTVYHPDYECDDVISSLVKKTHLGDECIVISNDTDFIQLYSSHNNVSIYSPVKKSFLMPTEYDYVSWKSLVGDVADNIKGVSRVGKKTATKILKKGIGGWIKDNPKKAEIFLRNQKLIAFKDVNLDELIIWNEETDFDYVKSQFENMEFNSMINNKSWKKYIETFKTLYKE